MNDRRDPVSSSQKAFSKYQRWKHMSRTHETLLPSPNVRPPLQKVFHNEHVGDNALVVPKGQATNRGEQRTSECVPVLQQSGDSGGAVAIGVRIRARAGRSPTRSRIRRRVQTSAMRNRSDTVAFLMITTRTRGRVRDVALPRIFSAERSVVLRAWIVAHTCKTQKGEAGSRNCSGIESE